MAGHGGDADGDEEEARGAGTAGSCTARYFYGVVRAAGLLGRSLPLRRTDFERIRHRELEALLRAVPHKLPVLDTEHVRAHQHALEPVLRHATVLPAPYGVVFRDAEAVQHFLEDQYLALHEGLAFLEGHWEMRLDITPAPGVEAKPQLEDAAVHAYAELRRFAHAAIPFAREGRRLLRAAFLVERASWTEFVARANALGASREALVFELTGPWPPYDFVRMAL